MRKGLLHSLLLYLIGIALTLLISFTVGNGYNHGPGYAFIPPVLTLLVSVFWTVGKLFEIILKGGSPYRAGVMIGNVSALLLVALYFWITIQQERATYASPEPATEILEAQRKGDSSIILIDGKLMFLSIRDSVIIDKRDSLVGARK